jgi:hypothetical protein
MMEANFDPAGLVTECRDLGNARYADQEFQKAEEAFTLGMTIYEMYGDAASQTAGYGCLVGLADCLRAQSRHDEAEELIRQSRDRLRKTA